MWQSAISCSLDYTFISFERVASYERDRFAPIGAARPFPARWREVVTGEPRSACRRVRRRSSQHRSCDEEPSLGIALVFGDPGFTDMSHLFTARSLGRGASLDSWGR